MKQNSWIAIGLVLAVVGLTGFVQSCGSDEASGDCSTAQFRATIKDRVSRAPLGNYTVHLIKNHSNERLGQTKISAFDPLGDICFDDIGSEEVGFFVEGKQGLAVDTYNFNLDPNAKDEEVWSVDQATYDLAPKIANVRLGPNDKLDPTKSLIAGGFYWVNAAGDEEGVGCGTVKAFDEQGNDITPLDDTGGQARYFGNNDLPVDLVEKFTTTSSTEGRTGINALNGTFIIANLNPGKITIKGYDPQGVEVASQETQVFAGANSILILNIYAKGLAANPGIAKENEAGVCCASTKGRCGLK